MHTSFNSTDSSSPPTYRSLPQPLQLLDFLLSDAATDVEVVARELGLRDEMLVRLRRALDRLNCGHEILGAMTVEAIPRRAESGGVAGATHRLGCQVSNGARRCRDTTMTRVRRAFEVLAMNWPQDYPDDAVEWFLFEDQSRAQIYVKD